MTNKSDHKDEEIKILKAQLSRLHPVREALEELVHSIENGYWDDWSQLIEKAKSALSEKPEQTDWKPETLLYMESMGDNPEDFPYRPEWDKDRGKLQPPKEESWPFVDTTNSENVKAVSNRSPEFQKIVDDKFQPPKEEPIGVEEAANKFIFRKENDKPFGMTATEREHYAFIKGAKWQAQQDNSGEEWKIKYTKLHQESELLLKELATLKSQPSKSMEKWDDGDMEEAYYGRLTRKPGEDFNEWLTNYRKNK